MGEFSFEEEFGFTDEESAADPYVPVQEEAVSTNYEQPPEVDADAPYSFEDEFGFDEEAAAPVEVKEEEADLIDQLIGGYYDFRSRGEFGAAVDIAKRDVSTPETTDWEPGTVGHMLAQEMPALKKQQIQEKLDSSASFATKGEAIPLSNETLNFLDENSEMTIWEGFKAAPVKIITELGARSGAAMGPGLVAGAALGAAAGPAGFATGMGVGSARVDYAATIIESIKEEGVDITSADAVQKFVDSGKLQEIETKALKRAAVVGGVDAIAGLVGAKVIAPGVSGNLAREITNVAVQLPVQAGLGAAGEAGGQLAAGDELNLREIAAEAAGELVTAPVEVATAAYSGARGKKTGDTEDPPGPMSDLENQEKDTAQMGADIEQLKAMNAEEIGEYQQQVREDVAARGGDQLEQELAAAQAGNAAGQVLDSEVETLTRLWNQRQAIDEEARYAEDQVKEDEARAKTQEEASKRYEAGLKQVAADQQAAEQRIQAAEKSQATLERERQSADVKKTAQAAAEQEAVRKTRAAEKADNQLNKLRKRRQELGLEPKGELEGTSPYPSAQEVAVFKGAKPKNPAMAEALAAASAKAAKVAKGKAGLGKDRILFRKGEEGASKRLVEEIKNNEGFTVNNKTGQPVTEGYSVGQGMEQVIDGEVTDAQLDAFRETHAEALADPDNVLGAWYNKDDGKTYLDVSKVFKDRTDAMLAGVTNKELAIYDLKGKNEIRLDAKGDKYFAKEALKEPHVQMKPEDFLGVAETLRFANKQKEADLRTVMDTMGEKLSSLPVLTVKDGKVVGHEGRHRALELMSRGVESIPVRVIGDTSEMLTSQDGKRQIPFPKGKEGRNFTNFFSSITKGLAGKSSTGKEYSPVITLKVSEGMRSFVDAYIKYRGNFDDHIAFSIPGFKEVQIAVGSGIAKVYGKGATILDIGASEGSFVKAITSVSGAHTIALDPNEAMQDTFNATPVEGSEYSLTAFGTREQQGTQAWPADEEGPAIDYFDPQGKKYDVVHEAMVFQFVSPDRQTQISSVKQVLSADGVAIFEEKMFTNAQEANETKKNEYKRQYFEQKEMTKKAAEVLEGMDENTVHQENLEQTLKDNFKHVVQFWDSGNFKGYVASDSQMAANRLVSAIGDTSSEFSTTATPRKVESPQAVRADVQLRRVDKAPAKVVKAEAEVVVKELNDKLPGLKVNLLENPYGLPDALFDAVSENFGAAAMGARGMIDSKTGEIYVFSDNHSSLEDLVTTVMHEGVGHKGLRVLFNEQQRTDLLDSVFANGDRRAMNRIAKSYGLDTDVVGDQRLIADEYIAEMAEGNMDTDIFQKVIDAVRQVLKSLGLLSTWTDADIKALLRRTRSALKDGKPLSKIKLRTEMEVEETGEIVTVEQTASVALRQMDKRIEVLKKLRGCVG